MAKLTLSVDEVVIARAKEYAKRTGASVSQLVETYLAAVADPAPTPDDADAPILRSLRGSLKSGDIEDYHKHLERKYLGRKYS